MVNGFLMDGYEAVIKKIKMLENSLNLNFLHISLFCCHDCFLIHRPLGLAQTSMAINYGIKWYLMHHIILQRFLGTQFENHKLKVK